MAIRHLNARPDLSLRPASRSPPRLLQLVASLPAATAAALLAALVPESPRYLSVMGRGREAGQVGAGGGGPGGGGRRRRAARWREGRDERGEDWEERVHGFLGAWPAAQVVYGYVFSVCAFGGQMQPAGNGKREVLG